jgi:CPA1 family monovalent cation:H+ antiporter
MSNFITVADRNPGWKAPIIAGWAGMRGVVSLAAALSIPLMVNGSEPFPHRNLILFITFIVILVTLVFQGLTLPWVIRKLNVEDKFSKIPIAKQEQIIQKKIAQRSLIYLREKYGEEAIKNEHLDNLLKRLQIDLNFLQLDLPDQDIDNTNKNGVSRYQHIYLSLLEQQRMLLNRMNTHDEFDEELIRKYLALTDLEEFKMREKLIEER